MIDKNNFKVNISQKSVVLEISKDIFPIPVILRAAYHFIDDAKVIVKEGGKNKIKVVFYFPEETGKSFPCIPFRPSLNLVSDDNTKWTLVLPTGKREKDTSIKTQDTREEAWGMGHRA